jgi:alpha-D-ribose 1-methylphosphonate 5-triphosphate diphosphatase
MIELDLIGAQVLRPEGMSGDRLSIAEGRIVAEPVGRAVDMAGFMVLPGIVDVHGDAFERHVAPRRGAMKQMTEGLAAVDAELACNGITTAVLAQFVSWEGGLRAPAFADQVLEALDEVRPKALTDMRCQLRFETHMLDEYEALLDRVDRHGVGYVVFNDHLPHDRLADGRTPKRLVAQALKAGRNPDAHHAMMRDLHARAAEVPAALEGLCAALRMRGVAMGSHDDRTAETCAIWQSRGVSIAEFPETLEAIEATRAAGGHVILGAPNVVRGGSHNGNLSALEQVMLGHCDALASDYHYPSPRRAALMMVQAGALDWSAAWELVSDGPARVLGLTDRGRLASGLRADVLILEQESHRVAGTMVAGRFSYLSGALAERLIV